MPSKHLDTTGMVSFAKELNMKYTAGVIFVLVAALALIVPAEQSASTQPKVEIPGHGKLFVSRPYTHKNLAVYILYSDKKINSEPEYITLEEGIKARLVKVTEAKRAQVEQLRVTNKAKLPLYLQVGDLVSGGRQDRTLQSSLVIPPKTRKAPIPSFCVEQGRWSDGTVFQVEAVAIPSKETRLAIQAGDQGKVWDSVTSYKKAARANLGGGSSRISSVNEELQSKDFQKITAGYIESLSKASTHFPRPLGMAYAINGEISTVDVYNSRLLFDKLYPRLLKTAAAEAAAEPPQTKKSSAPTAKQLAGFIASAGDGKKQIQKLGYGNTYIRIWGQRSLMAQLFYEKKVVHSQVMTTPDQLVNPPKVAPDRPLIE